MVGRKHASGRRTRFEALESRDLPTADLSATNVLVLYNANSAAGAQIANYYAQVHPGVHLLAITGVDPNNENITADAYLSTIRPQVLAALTPSIDVIVTTKGLPLRIDVTESEPYAPWPTLPTYIDGNGVLRSIINWEPYSSLESELANIQTVSTWQMMGDQSYWIGLPVCLNPYYHATASFSHSAYGSMYLTSRLDAYTTADVEGAIDRAQHAFIGPSNSPSGPYFFLVDNDPTKNYAPTMAALVNGVLMPAGMPVVYDNTSAFISTAPGPIIGYDSHGVHQASTPANYLSALNVTLASGAVFNSWESYNAYSFTPGGYSGGQGQIAQWLAIGGTAGVGNVEEPGASTQRVANEDQLFQMLLAGKTWAEAAWSSFAQLGFVNTVVGDPLMKWNPLPQAPSATVTARHLFYNNSIWDGRSTDVGPGDDDAIAIDKVAYLSGSGGSNFNNVSSYVKGINGLMIDLSGPHGSITANDFIFRVGNNNSPDFWSAAPPPSAVVVRPGAGANGADRIEITWADGQIVNTWLQVTLRGDDAIGASDANTGLAASDVFYFGNAPGDSGCGDSSSFVVTSTDEISARNDPHGALNLASIVNVNDFNRDRQVNSSDQILARNNCTGLFDELAFLMLGVTGGSAPSLTSVFRDKAPILSPLAGDAGVTTALADIATGGFLRPIVAAQPSFALGSVTRASNGAMPSLTFQNRQDQVFWSVRSSRPTVELDACAADQDLPGTFLTPLLAR